VGSLQQLFVACLHAAEHDVVHLRERRAGNLDLQWGRHRLRRVLQLRLARLHTIKHDGLHLLGRRERHCDLQRQRNRLRVLRELHLAGLHPQHDHRVHLCQRRRRHGDLQQQWHWLWRLRKLRRSVWRARILLRRLHGRQQLRLVSCHADLPDRHVVGRVGRIVPVAELELDQHVLL
jgi:hypothetical protein